MAAVCLLNLAQMMVHKPSVASIFRLVARNNE
jgi:hypothetical protein